MTDPAPALPPKEEPPPSNAGGYGEVVRLAWPLIVSTGSFTVMQFCDRIFLSWHSGAALQASLPGGIMAFTFISLFMGLCSYSNTFVSQYHGAGEPLGCSRSTVQAFYLALGSWPLILLCIPLGRWLITLSGHPAEVQALEKTYFTILMFGGFVPGLGVAASGFFSGRGDTRTAMYAHVAASLANIGIDYVLIFGKLGLPALGIRGAALATVISGSLAPVVLITLMMSARFQARYHTRRVLALNWPLLKRMLRFGFPHAVNFVLDHAAFTVFIMLAGRMGGLEMALMNMTLNLESLAFMPLIGLGIAAGILVGKYQGACRSELARRCAWKSLTLGIGYMCVIGASYLLFPAFYFGLYTSRSPDFTLEQVLPTGRVMLAIVAVWGLANAINLVLGGALKGAGDTRFVMWYSLLAHYLVWLPGVIILAVLLKTGMVWLWAWTAGFIFVFSIGLFWRFRSGRWQHIEVIDRTLPLPPTRPSAESLVIGD